MTFEFGPKQTKLLEALESGNFQQASGTLRDEDIFVSESAPPVTGYCCLGVANLVCELDEPWGHDVLNDKYLSLGLYTQNGQTRLSSEIAGDVLSEVGRAENDKCLTVMNDNGKTFAEIAAVIRANPEQYFSESK